MSGLCRGLNLSSPDKAGVSLRLHLLLTAWSAYPLTSSETPFERSAYPFVQALVLSR